jgi:AcrR family transcriptional regulator
MASKRRTQAERRDHTRTALRVAALECLVEQGIAHFTTTEVCRRAGLSQGALFKHFATKSELLAATIEHLFDQLRADFEANFGKLPRRNRNARHGLALLWDQMCDPRLAAAFDLYTAARTDPTLQRALGPVVDAHLTRVHELAVTLLGGVDPARARNVIDLATLAIQGLVIDQMALPDPRHRERLRRFLFELVPLLAA